MSAVASPLNALHEALGAKLIDFHGWLLPVQYAGILKEHEAVRQKAGVFDVSHMGEFLLKGEGAQKALNRIVAGNCLNLEDGQCLYSPMCNETGGTVDDLLVYKFAQDDLMIVVNAANIQKDFDWISSHLSEGLALENISDQIALIAVQGPEAEKYLSPLIQPVDLKTYRCAKTTLNGEEVILSRTGYTGEDGFEIYGPAPVIEDLMKKLVETGVEPCGLGARDTLRLEARLPLYGQELGDDINPVEAGLKRFLDLEGPEWIGQDKCREMAENPPRKLVGLQLEDRQAARTHTPVLRDSEIIGEVTSGSFLPTVGASCSLALVRSDSVKINSMVEVDLRGRKKPARVVRLPFYKKGA